MGQSIFQHMTDEEILRRVKEYYTANSGIKSIDFQLKNNLPSGNYLRKRFGSLKKVYELCDIPVEDKMFSKFKRVPDEELLDRLRWFHATIGFPTNRMLCNRDDMPSYTMYYDRFGSLRNAIICAGIEVPKSKLRFFDRKQLTDEEMLKSFKYYVSKHLKDDDTLLFPIKTIDEIPGLQGNSVYLRRFGTIENLYKLIGYDYYNYNKAIIKRRMLKKYLEINELIDRVPNSRDIEEYSRNYDGFYSMSSYEEHFGSLYKLQIEANLIPTVIGRNKSEQDLLDDLIWLKEELGRTPHFQDLSNYRNVANTSKYIQTFGGFSEALILAGIEPNVEVYRTKKGTKCLSYYELRITEWMEDNNITYQKEVLYRDVIVEDTTLRRFDWVVEVCGNKLYIEMFGIVGREDYLIKTQNKINDCKKHGINLIALYPDDLKRPLNEVFSFLFKEESVV